MVDRALLEQTQQTLEAQYQQLQERLEQTKAELNATLGALRLNEEYLADRPSVASGDDAGQAAVPSA